MTHNIIGAFIIIAFYTFVVTTYHPGSGPFVNNKPDVHVVAGASATGELKIVPGDDWYWNKEYPHKFEMKSEKQACISGHVIRVRPGAVKTSVDFSVTSDGTPRCKKIMLIHGRFGLCSKTTCLVISDDFEINVNVKEN